MLHVPASKEIVELLRREVEVHRKERLPEGSAALGEAPAAKVESTTFLTLRRGPRLMVVFRGPPDPSIIMSLRTAQVMVGLALSPSELATIRRLHCYSYVFVSAASHKDQALSMAASDLHRANWSIEDGTATSKAPEIRSQA